MRALCGAIITAGALLGLGLVSIGFGVRYQNTARPDLASQGAVPQIHLGNMDRPLEFILVFMTCLAIIGLALAFVGLAYHHHKRHHEFLRNFRDLEGSPRVPTP